MSDSLRLDKWLWQARFFKSRSLAAKHCQARRVRCNGATVTRAHHPVRPGDVLTFPQARHVRVVRILALGTRRGPASEAAALFDDLNPPGPETALPPGTGGGGAGPRRGPRPTGKARRDLARLRGEEER